MKCIIKTTVFLLALSLCIFSQTISISGKVLTEDGSPLKNCRVSLRKADIRTTTNASGEYYLQKNVVAVNKFSSPRAVAFNNVHFTNNNICLTLAKPENVKVQLFDIKGRNIVSWSSGNLGSGSHSYQIQKILNKSVSPGVYILTVGIGSSQFKYTLTKHAERISISQPSSKSMQLLSSESSNVAAAMATVDTIDFRASGYKSKAFLISKYEMKCENVVLEEEEEDEEADEPQSINLTTSLLKGKWACIFYDQDGCEQYVPVNNYTITNMTIVPSTTNNMFIGTWGTWDLEGGIVDQKNLLIILSRSDIVFNRQDIRIIALTQSHPDDLLAGSVFSGVGAMGTFNLTTGQQVCIGTFNFMMVRDFTDIGGTSTSSGSTYNPKKSGFESNQSTCLTDYLSCSKGCSFTYGPESANRYSTCIAKCNDEKRNCEKGR
jgi:hypothetical protein